MKLIARDLTQVLVCLAICLLSASQTMSQSFKVDLDALTNETQKSSPDPDEITLVWWIPNDFWTATFEAEKIPKSQIDEFMGLVAPYTIIVVVDGKIGREGKIVYRAESDVRRTIRIADLDGKEYLPLPIDKYGPGVTAIVKVIRPMLVSAMGPLGANMNFFVFPAKGTSDKAIADPRSSGTIAVKLDGSRKFEWRLPLTTLMPPKFCPVDGAKLNGAYKYCPFHGKELN